MTSNIGAKLITDKTGSLGFSGSDNNTLSYETIKEKVTGELKKNFKPEFINRIDEVIVYIEISPSEKEFIALTKNKKLYHYTSDDYNGKVELFRENVIYATYRNNEIMTINETEIK